MKITVYNKEQAWEEANKIFPADYEKDFAASERAGYDIYRHPTLNYYNRICDLGDRLEVLTGEYGENVTNIWIEPEIIKNMGTNMTQADYIKLADEHNTHTPETWVMTEDEAKIYINREFGFEASRIKIISEVHNYRKEGNCCVEHQTFTRKPQYCATDYNYVRFDVNNWYYEIVNGQLYQYYC